MLYLIRSNETASSNIASYLIDLLGLEAGSPIKDIRCLYGDDTRMLCIDGPLVYAEFLDGAIDGTAIFLSRHSSSKHMPAFTVHSEGNFSDNADLGGRPRSLSIASPSNMLGVLQSINRINKTGVPVTYEATHHGPFLNFPSFFAEIGGNEDSIENKSYAELMARAIRDSMERNAEYDKVAIGIGSTHYPEKFTRLALEGKYAFSHIISRHNIDSVDMLASAINRSDRIAEVAVIEWKGLKGADREVIIRELDRLGIDYAKV